MRTLPESNTQAILQLRNLKVQRGEREVLNVPWLEVMRGEALTIIGPNGAGKSTLLLTMAALLQPAAGEVIFNGRALNRRWQLQYRRQIGLVFQEPLLLSDSVFNNVAAGLRFRGIAKAEVKRRVNDWLERLNIRHLAKRPARAISGGEAQRANLARSFALQADLLLLDEPFSALDAPSRTALQIDFQRLIAETHQTAVFVTHDLEEAVMLGNRVAVLIEGELRQVGRPDEIFAAPADMGVAAYVGVENILPGVTLAEEDGLVSIALDGFQAEVVGAARRGQRVYVCLRPEDIILQLEGENPRSSARNRLRGRIRRIVSQGALSKVLVDCGFQLTALVTRASMREMGLETGMTVSASFKATAAHLIPRQ